MGPYLVVNSLLLPGRNRVGVRMEAWRITRLLALWLGMLARIIWSGVVLEVLAGGPPKHGGAPAQATGQLPARVDAGKLR